MKKDLENREDLKQVVITFYEHLLSDVIMIPFFEKFLDPQHLEEHLEVLVDFWDQTLFYSGTYTRNAMKPHIELNQRIKMEERHFSIWLDYFNRSVDEYFEGNNAEVIKNRALSIATVMKLKLGAIPQ